MRLPAICFHQQHLHYVMQKPPTYHVRLLLDGVFLIILVLLSRGFLSANMPMKRRHIVMYMLAYEYFSKPTIFVLQTEPCA